MIGTKWIAPIQDKVRRTSVPVFLAGISGVIRVDHEVDIWIKQLNTALTVYVLEGELCPVLSEGRLCIDMGFDTRWPAFSTNPVLRRPDGVEQALVVEYYTPNLETGGNIKAGFAGAARAYYRPADADETWAAPAQDTSDEHTRLPATPGVAIAKAKPKAKAKQNTVTDTGGGMELLMEEPAAVGPTDPATVADTTGDDSIPPPPPTPPPAYVEITEDDLCEHERPQATVMTKRKGEVNTLRHLMTHSVFNPYCEACVLANQNRKANRRRQQTDIVKPKKFGTWTLDHFHGKDKKLTQGITGTKSGLVVYDLGTEFGYMYALTDKGAENATDALVHFKGRDKCVSAYSDASGEIKAAIKAVGSRQIPHERSIPGVPATNGLAEAMVKRTIRGIRVAIERAGFPRSYYDYAGRHHWTARNIETGADGKTPWERRFGDPFTGLTVPFGAEVNYVPSDISPNPTQKLDQNTKPGVFLGYDLEVGHKWKGVYIVAALTEFINKDLRRDARAKDSKVRVEKVRIVRMPPYIKFPLKSQYEKANRSLTSLIRAKEVFDHDKADVRTPSGGNDIDTSEGEVDGGRPRNQCDSDSDENDEDAELIQKECQRIEELYGSISAEDERAIHLAQQQEQIDPQSELWLELADNRVSTPGAVSSTGGVAPRESNTNAEEVEMAHPRRIAAKPSTQHQEGGSK